MTTIFANLSSAFQSLHVPSREGRVVAPAFTENNRYQPDILSIGGQSPGSGVYKPAQFVNTQTFTLTEAQKNSLCTQLEEELWARATTTTTVEAYYGDTLLWTRTTTGAPALLEGTHSIFGLHYTDNEEWTPEGKALMEQLGYTSWDAGGYVAGGYVDANGFTKSNENYDPSQLTYKATSTMKRANPDDPIWFGGSSKSDLAKSFGFDDWSKDKPTERVSSEYVGTDRPTYYDFEKEEWMFGPKFELGKLGGGNNIGIFKGSNPYTSLSTLVGLEEVCNTKDAFLSALDKLIKKESEDINVLLSRKLREAGMQDVTKKITFAEDEEGNIVVTGNISARQKKKLAALINNDPELVDRIKTQKARMEIAEELKKEGTIDKRTGDVHKVNLGDKKFDAARTQLLKGFLEKNDLSINNLSDGLNENLDALLTEFPDLRSEIDAYKERVDGPKPTHFDMPVAATDLNDGKAAETDSVRALLSMKRGVLSEGLDEEPDFRMQLAGLRKFISDEIVDEINELYKMMPDMMITDFDMTFDSNGRMTITNVTTWGNDPEDNKQMAKIMNSWFPDDMQAVAKEIGLGILDAHDDEHGDVQEFKHEVIASGWSIEILSPDADKAALAEIAELTQEIGIALNEYFGKTMGITSPFEIIFGNDGLLSLGNGSLSYENEQKIKQVLEDINTFIEAERAGEETEGMLSVELLGIAEKFMALKDAQDKIHDKSLLPEKGIRFCI